MQIKILKKIKKLLAISGFSKLSTMITDESKLKNALSSFANVCLTDIVLIRIPQAKGKTHFLC